VTKNLTKPPDLDPGNVAALPINKLAMLRAEALAAIAAYEAVDDWFSPEGRSACRAMILACAAANAEMERLASDPKTRHGAWRTPFDVELMVLGYI
jgi:hypothetical protein